MDNLIQNISEITKNEKNLIFRSEEELLQCMNENELVVKEVDGNVLGFVICKSLTDSIVEVGCLYVSPEYRKNGYGKELLNLAIAKAQGKKIFVRTKESKLKELFAKYGFKPVSLKLDWNLGMIYLKDRLVNPYKFWKFLKTLNNGSCAYILAN